VDILSPRGNIVLEIGDTIDNRHSGTREELD
jgi:hypothetical protein